MKFIILGAGLSGLSCAVTLKKYGHDVCIIEKESTVGGLARSYRFNGYTFDYGPHFLFGSKVSDLIYKEFPGIKLNRIESTKEKMYFQNKYFNFPFDPKNILLNMEKTKIPKVLGELLFQRLFNHPDDYQDQNIEDWVIQAVGKEIYHYISLGQYIQKLYGLHPKEISHEWGIQKLKFLARWRGANFLKLVSKSFFEERNVKRRIIHYPATAIDYIPNSLAEIFQGVGGKIFLNTEAVSIESKIDGIFLNVMREGEQIPVKGDFLISTIPLSQLVGMLSPAMPIEIGKQAELLKSRTLLLLYLCIKKECVLKDQCIYFTEEPYFFRRITEFKHLNEGMALQGKTSLCIETTCFEGDDIYQKGQEEILAITVEQLERGGYLKRGDIEDYRFQQIPFAYPVYTLSYSSALESIFDQLQVYRNILSIGRQGLFFYNAMNSSLIMSCELGKKLAVSNRGEWEQIIRDTYKKRLGKYSSKVCKRR